ncbi:MAG: polyketide synthase dehydratase domain-containing protein, partial [Ramlibacter sp.]|nr:polyketide synthase dehydratase domain-containing protein [Ramlibacter sp.]
MSDGEPCAPEQAWMADLEAMVWALHGQPSSPPTGHLVALALPDEETARQLVQRLKDRGLAQPERLLDVRCAPDAKRYDFPWRDREAGGHGIVVLQRHPDGRGHEWLLGAAHDGWFAVPNEFRKYPAGPSPASMTLNRLERRGYTVRTARESDLPALMRLEEQCWPPALSMPTDLIRRRLARFPQGNLALDFEGDVVAAIYAQRIRRIRDLQGLNAREAEALHRDDGTVVQLLAVNVLPGWQDRSFGDQLLELMLQQCTLMPGVEAVVGVTRCKDYARHAGQPYDAYTARRNGHGKLVDTILRFHEAHGARIRGPMPDYRPQDAANHAYGVLVHYDIQHRKLPDAAAGRAGMPARGSGANPTDCVRQAVASILDMAAADVPLARPLFELGMDSAALLDLNERVGSEFGVKLGPAFFFEYNTCEKIAAYLQSGRGAADESPADVKHPAQRGERPAAPRDDIAIIGMAFVLPGGVEDEAQLWDLLTRQGDAIGDLPQGRWAWPAGISPHGEHRGIARGGFLADIAGFDAGLFHLSRKEAELMDPQQRMMLELSWACLEDAGYTAQSVAGSRTGVYVGASGSDYEILLKDGREVEALSGLGSAMSVIPNRISHYYDLRGPSIQVDAACSSSLVALHEAAQALRAGQCEQALAGGIHLMCHPANTIAYYKAGMLSADGRCATFDAQANGYVRGEGAAMLLLKPLARARSDGDRIYAVIKGTAVNHGGRASGLTVPNPAGQAALLRQAYESAAIDARTISYVEAHGTGTSLGDPIEVRALKQAFAGDTMGAPGELSCGIGSIKTRIGHLEAAAGIAGLLQVIASMRRRMLPASLNFSTLNPHIDLSGSAFYVVAKAQPWELAPGQPLRRAGVSSFGSGGTNAHAVVEEYTEPVSSQTPAGGPAIIVLSAGDAGRLRLQAQRLLTVLAGETFGDADLADIAYTLQVGREAMQARLACVASSIADLSGKLERFLAGQAAGQEVHAGEAEPQGQTLTLLSADEDMARTLSAWLAKAGWDKLLALWVRGLDLDWGGLYGDSKPRRVGLPTYPFLRKHYWLPAGDGGEEPSRAAQLHPLLHDNTSSLEGQRFTSTFSGREFFLADHRVRGKRVLPAAAHLEMARAAIAHAAGGLQAGPGLRVTLRDVVFSRAVVAGEQPLALHVAVWPQSQGMIGYEIYSGTAPDIQVHSQGIATLGPQNTAPICDLTAVRVACRQVQVPQLYAALEGAGFAYGPAHRGIAGVHAALDAGGARSQVLARVALASGLAARRSEYALHPSVLDAAFQAATWLLLNEADMRPSLPFAIEELEIIAAPPAEELYAWVRYSAGSGPHDSLRKL